MLLKIPQSITVEPLQGLELLHQGKVRDSYKLPSHPSLMLVVTTDRISIFDVVLPTPVPNRGETLNALNIWWRMEHFNNDVVHDLVAFGKDIDVFLPANLRGNRNLHRRATVVKRLRMIDAELIIRGYLTGSIWDAYQKTTPHHEFWGTKLPQGLHHWSALENPIFTPTTKSEVGLDEAIDERTFIGKYGRWSAQDAMIIYRKGKKIAEKQGITLIDTKLEFGHYNNVLMLADECLTLDSSRYVLTKELQEAQSDPTRKNPPTVLGKQAILDWGQKELGFGPNTPLTKELRDRIHKIEIPQSVLQETSSQGNEFFEMLTGQSLQKYQDNIIEY